MGVFIAIILFALVYEAGAGISPSGEFPFLFFRHESSSHRVEQIIKNELLQKNERLKSLLIIYLHPPTPPRLKPNCAVQLRTTTLCCMDPFPAQMPTAMVIIGVSYFGKPRETKINFKAFEGWNGEV